MTTTWTAIQQHMRGKYQLQDDTPDMMSMVWVYDDNRSQKIIVRRFRSAGRELVEFKSAFARRVDVEPETLMTENSRLPIATVALSGDVYLAIYNALLDHLHLDDFDFLLSRVAGVADTLEEKFVRRDEF